MTHASKYRLLGFVSSLALMPVLAFTNSSSAAVAADSGGHGDAASCQALAGADLGSGMSVTAAEYHPDGASFGRTKVSLPFCRIVGVAKPSSDSNIGFEIWLPPASSWNGKYQQEGSGGSSGSIGQGSMAEPLEAGYATLATDNGHITDPNAPEGGSEQSWAIGHPEKMVDFAWRAVHVSSLAAKDVIERFYGKKAAQSYFVGCSTGGRQALMEATRFPEDFDGILAGAPAWHWTNQMINAIWNTQAALKDASAITDESAQILHKAVMDKCDGLDGVKDGVISDPRRCVFDPKTIQCKAGQTKECLTPVQADAATRIYDGSHRSDGSRIFQGYAKGSELNWPRIWAGKYPGGSAWDFWHQSVSQDKDAAGINFDFDKDTDKVLNGKLEGGTYTEAYNVKTDLSAFEKRGGKLIQYHGWADQQISPYASIDYYNQTVGKMSKAERDGFYRLYMLPGIYHCAGGPGVGNIGDSSSAVQHDPEHDLVEAMDAWVTKHKAPTVLIGTHLDDNKKADRTRPLCPYPLEAKYKGQGDINKAESFACKDPGQLPRGAM
jgi:feruloyl esterase